MYRQKARCSKEECHHRGQEIFARKIEPLVVNQDPYKFVAIDIESEEFVVDSDSLAATHRLLDQKPDAQIWMRRVGFEVAHWFSGATRPDDQPRWRKVS